eukprot:scaffold3066_cov454-Pavlova_lutheri.AAC.1
MEGRPRLLVGGPGTQSPFHDPKHLTTSKASSMKGVRFLACCLPRVCYSAYLRGNAPYFVSGLEHMIEHFGSVCNIVSLCPMTAAIRETRTGTAEVVQVVGGITQIGREVALGHLVSPKTIDAANIAFRGSHCSPVIDSPWA